MWPNIPLFNQFIPNPVDDIGENLIQAGLAVSDYIIDSSTEYLASEDAREIMGDDIYFPVNRAINNTRTIFQETERQGLRWVERYLGPPETVQQQIEDGHYFGLLYSAYDNWQAREIKEIDDVVELAELFLDSTTNKILPGTEEVQARRVLARVNALGEEARGDFQYHVVGGLYYSDSRELFNGCIDSDPIETILRSEMSGPELEDALRTWNNEDTQPDDSLLALGERALYGAAHVVDFSNGWSIAGLIGMILTAEISVPVALGILSQSLHESIDGLKSSLMGLIFSETPEDRVMSAEGAGQSFGAITSIVLPAIGGFALGAGRGTGSGSGRPVAPPAGGRGGQSLRASFHQVRWQVQQRRISQQMRAIEQNGFLRRSDLNFLQEQVQGLRQTAVNLAQEGVVTGQARLFALESFSNMISEFQAAFEGNSIDGISTPGRTIRPNVETSAQPLQLQLQMQEIPQLPWISKSTAIEFANQVATVTAIGLALANGRVRSTSGSEFNLSSGNGGSGNSNGGFLQRARTAVGSVATRFRRSTPPPPPPPAETAIPAELTLTHTAGQTIPAEALLELMPPIARRAPLEQALQFLTGRDANGSAALSQNPYRQELVIRGATGGSRRMSFHVDPLSGEFRMARGQDANVTFSHASDTLVIEGVHSNGSFSQPITNFIARVALEYNGRQAEINGEQPLVPHIQGLEIADILPSESPPPANIGQAAWAGDAPTELLNEEVFTYPPNTQIPQQGPAIGYRTYPEIDISGSAYHTLETNTETLLNADLRPWTNNLDLGDAFVVGTRYASETGVLSDIAVTDSPNLTLTYRVSYGGRCLIERIEFMIAPEGRHTLNQVLRAAMEYNEQQVRRMTSTQQDMEAALFNSSPSVIIRQ